ncbi:MAG: hypothetical protein ACRC50_00450 [Gaiella sp.]
MSIGAVLDEAWSLYTKFFVRFFLIALIVFAVVNLAYAVLIVVVDEGSAAGAVFASAVALTTTLVGTFWLQGALVHAVQDARDGTLEMTTSEVFARARPFVLPILLTSLLAALGILAGLLLLIVPGIILAVRWAVWTPALVLERHGSRASLGRSNELVKGYSWSILAIVLVTAIASGIASSLLQAAFSAFPQFVEIALGSTIASAVVVPFSAIALTVAFFRLRDAKEPPAADTEPVDAWA